MIFVTLSHDHHLRFWIDESERLDRLWIVNRFGATLLRPTQDMEWWMSED